MVTHLPALKNVTFKKKAGTTAHHLKKYADTVKGSTVLEEFKHHITVEVTE